MLLCGRGFVGAEEAVQGDHLKLYPNDAMARWLVGRLGLDLGVADAGALASKCETVHAATAAADALKGGVYEAIPTYGPITLVIVDPPFGLNKGHWDKPELAWGHTHFVKFLEFVCKAPSISKEGFCVAVYTMEDLVVDVLAAFEKVGMSAYKGQVPGGSLYKGSLTYIFANDGTMGFFPG